MRTFFRFKKKRPSSLRGFSLVEMIIAMFIFSLVMVAVTASFTQVVKVNYTSKRIQQNLEDVRFVFNRISKTLRTSAIVSTTTSGSFNSVRIFDYSQNKCVLYAFGEGVFKEGSVERTASGVGEKEWCATLPSIDLSPVAGSSDSSMTGKFYVIPSSDLQAGRITMQATITRSGISSTIQTTASLRNFEEFLP